MHEPSRQTSGSVRGGRLASLVVAALVALAAVVVPVHATPAGADPAGELIASLTVTATEVVPSTVAVAVVPTPDAPAGVTYAYQWLADGVDVKYPFPNLPTGWGDFGSSYRAVVTATAPDGRTQSLSTPDLPRFSRLLEKDQIQLTATSDTATARGRVLVQEQQFHAPLSDFTARAGPVTLTTTWLRDGVAVPGLTGSSREIVAGDIGHRASLRLVYAQAATGLSSTYQTSSTPVIGATLPPPRLTLTGSGFPMSQLNVETQDATPYPWSPLVTHPTFQWYRDGLPFTNPGQSQRQPRSTELGATFTVKVTSTFTGPRLPVPSQTMTTASVTVPGIPYVVSAVNNDRLRDVVYRDSHSGRWGLAFGQWSQRSYVQHPATDLPGGASTATAVVTGGDLNGDGVADVLARWPSGALTLLTVDDGHFGSWRTIGAGWNVMDLILLTGDLDGDHVGDVLARRRTDQALVLYRGRGDGTINQGLVIPGLRGTTRIVSIGDANGDGINDLHAIYPDGSLCFHAGQRGGRFANCVRVGSGWGDVTRLLSGGDVNGDGRADMYAVYPGKMDVIYGNGAGGFSGRQPAGLALNPGSPVF